MMSISGENIALVTLEPINQYIDNHFQEIPDLRYLVIGFLESSTG